MQTHMVIIRVYLDITVKRRNGKGLSMPIGKLRYKLCHSPCAIPFPTFYPILTAL